jgi:FkbM family methyltransferase
VSPDERREFFRRARGVTPYLAVRADDLLFFVSTEDHLLGRSLFVERRRQDMDVLAAALRLLEDAGASPRGRTFVDVGANIGTTTVGAVAHHGFERAVAVEPEPTNFRTLALNLAANDVSARVTAVQAAASDRGGEVWLSVSRRSSGLHRVVADGAGEQTISVPAVALDGLVEDGIIDPEQVGLLWLDAAGAEVDVLAGASLLLERRVPVVTAVRPGLAAWPETRSALLRALEGYTSFADVRSPDPRPTRDPAALLASFERPCDLLAFRDESSAAGAAGQPPP